MPAPCTRLASNRKIPALGPSPSLPLLPIGFVFSNPNLRRPKDRSKRRAQNSLCFFNPATRLWLGSFFQCCPADWLRSAKSPPIQKHPQLGSFFQLATHCPRSESAFGFVFSTLPSTPVGFVFSNPPHSLGSKRKIAARSHSIGPIGFEAQNARITPNRRIASKRGRHICRFPRLRHFLCRLLEGFLGLWLGRLRFQCLCHCLLDH